jgi:hypothetical protein
MADFPPHRHLTIFLFCPLLFLRVRRKPFGEIVPERRNNFKIQESQQNFGPLFAKRGFSSSKVSPAAFLCHAGGLAINSWKGSGKIISTGFPNLKLPNQGTWVTQENGNTGGNRILDGEAGGARGRAAASSGADRKRTIALLSANKQVGDRPAKFPWPDPIPTER